MAALDETESVLLRERWPNLLPRGDADKFPVVVPDGSAAKDGFGLPPGLSLPRRSIPTSPDSLALGLCRRVLSMSRFFIKVLWFESELIVLLSVGIVVERDCENRLPPNPGPGALIGVYIPKENHSISSHS